MIRAQTISLLKLELETRFASLFNKPAPTRRIERRSDEECLVGWSGSHENRQSLIKITRVPLSLSVVESCMFYAACHRSKGTGPTTSGDSLLNSVTWEDAATSPHKSQTPI